MSYLLSNFLCSKMAVGIAAKMQRAPALQSTYEHLAKGSADSVLPHLCLG